MVIQAGVGGFTGIQVFLHCSTNNKATTVLELFLNVVENYGLPPRVAGVGGFTGIQVFLHCSTNNKATTVLELFLNVVENYGLPPRVSKIR